MTNRHKIYEELIDEINLVETSLDEVMGRQLTCKDQQEKEKLERRILDYERHLRVLLNKLDLLENKEG